MSFVSALDAEIADLEADIKANPDPRVHKLADLRRVRAQHYADSIAVAKPPGSARLTAVDMVAQMNGTDNEPHYFAMEAKSFPRAPGRKRSPEREAALRQIAAYLTTKTQPVKTAEIYEMLQFKNIDIGGEDPKSNLSAMLSNAPEFQSHGRAGWTLGQ